MERKLCSCPNDLPASATPSGVSFSRNLPPRPGRSSEPHFKIGGKTSPGRFSRHFFNMFPNSSGMREDERSDSRNLSMPAFYITPQESLRVLRASQSGGGGPGGSLRTTLSPVKEHPALVITVRKVCGKTTSKNITQPQKSQNFNNLSRP